MPHKDTVFVFSAHSDDFVIGAGGTIGRYTREGKKVIAIVFSYGEKSHPWLKGEIVQKIRFEETFDASKILHCSHIFFDLKEFQFAENYAQKPEVKERLLSLFRTEKPSKIFTHSKEDPHPDHKAVHEITVDLIASLEASSPARHTPTATESGATAKKRERRTKTTPEVYIYSVWNPVSFNTQYPSLYVDVTSTFFQKLRALKTFRSQKIQVVYPTLLLLYRAIKDGFKLKTVFGEHFFRIR